MNGDAKGMSMEDFTVVPRERLEKLEEDERILNEIEAEARCRLGYGPLHAALCELHLDPRTNLRSSFRYQIEIVGPRKEITK